MHEPDTRGPTGPSLYQRLLADPSRIDALSPDERLRLGRSLRDRYLELSASPEDDEARARFLALVEAFDPEPITQLQGLSLSPCPSVRFRAVRFLEAEHLEPAHRELFARPSASAPHLVAAFVDPEEFSFRTFENIVPLDRLLEGTELALALGERAPLGPGRAEHGYTFSVIAPEATRTALQRLDALGLYVPPLNPGSRGGKRFIFHSALLAGALTEAVRAAMPKKMMSGFVHVNPVFRCNRFEPGDDRFLRHVDTPYHDAARDHVSRYTLLIYLTGGRGAPALRIDDVAELEQIEPMTAVVFDQRHPHEGGPYVGGSKVFLRTELIFEDADVAHEPGIAQLFARACYLSGEALFAPELERYAHEAYDRAAAARWRGLETQPPDPPQPFVHKRFRGVDFVANGYDFWFPPGVLSLEACAALTLLDVLNCKLDGQAFRKLCSAEVLIRDPHDPSWIPGFLASVQEPLPEPLFAQLELQGMFPPPEAPDPEMCCPFHAWHFEPSRCDEILDLHARAQRFARARIEAAPVQVMGQEIFLDPGQFQIRGNQIHVLTTEALQPVNFAACWNYGGSPASYLGVEATLQAPKLLVPPILFHRSEECIHLMFDLFRNAWMVTHQPQRVPVPRILSIDPGTAEESGEAPWMDAVDPALVEPDASMRSDEPWWSHGSALQRELFSGE